MGGMRRVGALAVVAVLGLGLAACGDDGDDDAAQDDTSDQAGTTEDESSDDALEGFDFTGECAAFIEAFAGAGSAVGSAFSGADQDLEQVAEYFSEISEQVPDEISADFEVFAEAYAEFAQAMADSDVDFSDPESIDPEDMEELSALGEAFSSAEVQEASENIQAYMAENCSAGG